MAGCGNLTGSSLDHVEIFHGLKKNGLSFDFESNKNSLSLDFDSDTGIGRITTGYEITDQLYDRVLSIFLLRTKEGRSSPVMIGDGQVVDLFKLYWVVRERGGYETVTAKGLWGKVAEVAGLCSNIGSSVKLVYAKYVNALDRWLQKLLKLKGITPERPDTLVSLDFVRLEAEIKDLFMEFSHWKEDMEAPNGCVETNSILTGDDGPAASDNILILECSGEHNLPERKRDNNETEILETHVIPDSLKRKGGREFMTGMLSWLRMVAQSPWDPSMKILWEGSKKKTGGFDEFHTQSLMVRESLFSKRHGCSSDDRSLLQKRQRMHPSIYEDTNGYSRYRLRCTSRLLSSTKPVLSMSSSETSVNLGNDSDKSLIQHGVAPKRVLRPLASLNAEAVVGLFCKDQLRKRVPVGQLFQAEIPVWTGQSCNLYNETKWLGAPHWPVKDDQQNNLNEIGRGRPDSCGCRCPLSVDCIRFHVSENRALLKHNLGAAFYYWKFNSMGEEVSLAWSEEEEKRFKALVRLNPPSLGRSFWDPVFKSFPYKARSNLVSYYFNVFILRRRSYQNRVTPANIDSDDEESEFGYLGSTQEVVESCDQNMVLCSENKQYLHLEEFRGSD